MQSYTGIGVMSGSSTDGLDVCAVKLTGDDTSDIWCHRINHAKTYQYSPTWAAKLRSANKCTAEQLVKLHVEFGHYIGMRVKEFIDDYDICDIKFVAVHGHTIFHQPSAKKLDEDDDEEEDPEKSCAGKGFTFQLGDGETIASYMRCLVVCNFRSKDLAVSGQGGPLVPVGEKHLFHQYNCFLNLGGIANVSSEERGFDICPCNMLLNHLANLFDSSLDYDEDGKIAAKGSLIPELLEQLNSLDFYQLHPPKALGRKWIETHVFPLLDLKKYKVEDLLRTSVEHVTDQISKALDKHIAGEDQGPVRLEKILLVTGGGALNKLLMDRLQQKITDNSIRVTIVETDDQTVVFKEAAIFAFLGLRCLLSLSTTMRSVTGAKRDVVGGSIHVPPGGSSISFADLGQQSIGLRPRSRSHAAGNSNLLGEGLRVVGGDGRLGLPSIGRGLPSSKAKMPAQRKISAPPSMAYLKFDPQTLK